VEQAEDGRCENHYNGWEGGRRPPHSHMGSLRRVQRLGEQNPENLHLGTGTGGVQLTGPPAAPCNSCQTKVVMGSLMPLEVHLVGV
jgi:hypothetical protein